MTKITGLILAAGKSTRFKGDKPKFLHTVLGKPILDYVTEAVSPFVDEILYVISPTAETAAWIPAYAEMTVTQNSPLGTGHAVMQALPQIHTDYVLIAFGDTPFITPTTIQNLCKSSHDITIAAFHTTDLTTPYGRVDPITKKIIQYKDATSKERTNPLCHAGIMFIKRSVLKNLLPALSNQNVTGEYYLTDVVNMFEGDIGMIEGTEEEFMGIDNRYDLAMAEQLKNKELMKQHMLNGVTFHGPDSTYLSHDTQIAADVEIGANVVFGPKVVIEPHARILPFCYLEDCIIRSHAVVGPFASICKGSELAEGAEIGTFVEVKKSYIGKKSKAKHLACLTMATVGERVIIGAGAITCNYNGKTKSQTTIQDGAFIGSNVNLIAPITVGSGAFIGAGSTVSKDIEANTLVVERAEERRKILKN